MMNAPSDPSDSLVFECNFEEPPEKVWRALTEPRLLEAWLTEPARSPSDSRTDPQDDPRTQAEDRPASSRPKPRDLEVLTAEPHRLLRYRWRDRENGVDNSSDREVHSVVTFELAAGEEGGTHLRLTHGEFRIVAAAPAMATARVRPITSARRRTRILSCVRQTSCIQQTFWRRAA